MADPMTFCPMGISAMSQPRRWRRWGWWSLSLVLLLLLVGELVARFGLGLGDPPLMMADPQIEYLYQPNQDCRRFGNRIKVNAYSMRSDDFPKQKNDPKEFRVLFLGDSVVNGGVLTDQKNLATEILKRELAAKLKRPVVMGNVSAGSWGPPNQLAYLKKYGTFDVDVLVFVFSSHDVTDVPTFEPTSPVRKPFSALWEGAVRYLPRYVPAICWWRSEPGPLPQRSEWQVIQEHDRAVGQCQDAYRQVILMARAKGIQVIAVWHRERDEVMGTTYPDVEREWSACFSEYPDVPFIQLGELFAKAKSSGTNPYRDYIHPNELGQKLIAEALLEPLVQAAGDSVR